MQDGTSKRKANHSKFKQARHCWHVIPACIELRSKTSFNHEPPSERRSPRLRGQEHAGALVQCRSRSQDIIDEQKLLSFESGPSADTKSVCRVFSCDADDQVRLSDCIADPLQGVAKLRTRPRARSRARTSAWLNSRSFFARDGAALARPRQRFAHQPGITQPLLEKFPQQSGEPCLAAILEAMNQLTQPRATASPPPHA